MSFADGNTWSIALGALAALLGASIGGLIQLWITRMQLTAEADKAERDELIEALTSLLEMTEEVAALADGATITGGRFKADAEAIRRASHAVARARLIVPPDSWAEIEPFVECAAAKANAAQLGSPESIQHVHDLGGGTAEGFKQLEDRALAAATSPP